MNVGELLIEALDKQDDNNPGTFIGFLVEENPVETLGELLRRNRLGYNVKLNGMNLELYQVWIKKPSLKHIELQYIINEDVEDLFSFNLEVDKKFVLEMLEDLLDNEVQLYNANGSLN